MSSVHNSKPSSHADRLIYAIIIIGITMIVEVVGGVMSNSLALLSDAGHMFTDLIALILSWSAYKIAMKEPDLRRSYGYYRFQVVAAFVNGLALFLIAGFIIFESIDRFINPIDVNWRIMSIVATLGLIANVAAFFVLYRKDEDNLNIKSAVLHIMGDLLGSVGAIIAAILIMISNLQIIDPILSIFVSTIILGNAYKVVKSSGHILLEGTPENINPNDVKSRIYEKISEVVEVYHMHIWSLTTDRPVITMHVKICNMDNYTKVLKSIKKLLSEEFNITHATIEIETKSYANSC